MDNTGFESGNWTHSNTSVSTSKPRTGEKSLTGNTSTASTTQYAKTTTYSLTKDKTYTFSGYVYTKDMQFTGKGIYLKATDSNGNTWTGEPIAYATTTDVDGGWARISVTFTPKATGAHTVYIYRTGATGRFYADDFQLELGEAPSSYNMVENGNMLKNAAWTFGTGASIDSGALEILTSPTQTGTTAHQDIPVNLPGTQTYVFSGWAKAKAAPNDQAITINATEGTFKKFGFRLILTYTDGTTETHFVPCNTELSVWQYVNYALIPQQPNKTVDTVRIVCVYEQNFKDARFDKLALVQEVAQSREYDSQGNLLSVTSTHSATDQNTYSDSNLLTKKVTPGNGTYTYDYGTGTNNWRLKSVSNGQVKETYTTDAMGHIKSTKISDVTGNTGKIIVTSKTYGTDGNRVASETDAAGNQTTYGYSSNMRSIYGMLGLPKSVVTPNGTKTWRVRDENGRMTQIYIANTAYLDYTYSSGNLTKVERKDSANQIQTYNFTYDDFGNTETVKVGTRTLATYTYDEGNGYLLQQKDGNNDTITYTYDILGRVETATYSDGWVLAYTYNGEGNLHSVSVRKNGTEVTRYLYNYDSLGRLMSSERKDSGNSVLRAHQSYDSVSRLTKQTWKLGSASYTESFTYNSTKDGSLNTHTTATGQTLTYSYDGLQRLTGVSGTVYNKTITYRNIDDTNTTTQVAKILYDLPSDRSFTYTYDSMGNIATYKDIDGTWTYTYDAQNQLTGATLGENTSFAYTYDTVGNILTGNGHTYTYGNSNWRDLLTKVDGQSITYDNIGNPTSYYNGTRWTFTWGAGKKLNTATAGDTEVEFTYDADGQRLTKKVNGVTHTYYYAGNKLLRETYGSNTLDFFYNADGSPYALKYNGTLYYYITNLQGDVMRVVDADGNGVARYRYDPYGNLIYSTGDLVSINPLRYRSYYYDSETGFYYLQSRYYDPELGRFINADDFASTGQGILGHNMFAYCGNNPVNRCDDTGTYYTPGQIHNFVVQDICDNNPNKTKDNPQITYNSPISRGNKWYMYGFCDVYDKVTHEVWEVKRISNAASCSPDAAFEQLANYVVHGYLKSQPNWNLKFGGEETSIRPNMFTVPDTDGKGKYLIGYFDAGYGLVYYDYAYIPSSGETVAAACAIICLYALFSGAGVTALGGVPGLLPV